MSVNTRAARRHSAWLVVTLLLLVSGCTASFLYNRLNFLIPWYFSGRVTLNERQETELKSAVSGFTAWHRTSQLTRYAGFLRTLAGEIQQPVSRQQIEAAGKHLESFWQDVVTEIVPDAAHWLGTLTPAQVDELLASFAEDDEDLKDDFCDISAEKLRVERTRSMTRSVKYWSGSLNDEQRAIIERAAASMEPTGCEWVESRALWRKALKELLDGSPGQAGLENGLKGLLLEPEKIWTPAYRAGSESNRTRLFDMFAELEPTWTSEQRAAAGRKLNGFAKDLDELAKD